MIFVNGQRVQWKAKDGHIEQGTIRDLLLAERNTHLKTDSYLLEMDYNGMIVAVATSAQDDETLTPIPDDNGTKAGAVLQSGSENALQPRKSMA